MGIVWSGTHSAPLDSKMANIVVGQGDVGENNSESESVMDARRNLPGLSVKTAMMRLRNCRRAVLPSSWNIKEGL